MKNRGSALFLFLFLSFLAALPISKMLIERLSLSSVVEVDASGIALVAAACNALCKGAVSVNNLWPGGMYNLPA